MHGQDVATANILIHPDFYTMRLQPGLNLQAPQFGVFLQTEMQWSNISQ